MAEIPYCSLILWTEDYLPGKRGLSGVEPEFVQVANGYCPCC
jgi:hypothetical protein